MIQLEHVLIICPTFIFLCKCLINVAELGQDAFHKCNEKVHQDVTFLKKITFDLELRTLKIIN